MSKIIGIDLGTGNSCVSVFEGGVPVVIANSEGKRTTPSVVGFLEDGERKIGDAGKRQAVTNAKNTVSSIKRFIGRTYDEAKNEKVTYTIVNENGRPVVDIYGRKYTPQEISAIILQKMKKTAEDYLGEKITEAVITVPARFSQNQRQATKEAGEIAGLNVRRIINEPTAAALAYGLDKANKDMKIAVFDSGQGTFDISILELGGGIFEVLSTNGDDHLGGDDFDQVIIDWLVQEFKNDEGEDLTNDPMAMQRLKESAEKAKIELSSAIQTEINLPYIMPVGGVPKHLVKTLTRAKFEQMSKDIINRHETPCIEALKAASLNNTDIDEVILVGGTTRIPAIQELVKKIFGREPNKSVNPDEAVSVGACIQGAILNKEEGVDDMVLLDVTPLNLGIESLGNVFTTLIEANTTVPCKKSQVFTTAQDMQPSVTIRIAQGDRPMFSDNKLLGQFNLDNIPPARRGIPQIEVSVDIDANSLVTVSAKDLATGNEQHITIQNNNLTKEELERMKKEAADNAEADKKRLEEVQKLNNADAYAFNIEKAMSEFGDKVTDEEKNKVTTLIEQLKKAVTEKNYSECDRLQKEISVIWEPIVSKIYQNNSGGQGGQSMNPNDFMNMFRNAQNMYGGAGQGGNTQTAQPETEDVQEAQEV